MKVSIKVIYAILLLVFTACENEPLGEMNINKNVLLHDIPFYTDLLNTPGSLLLSGFYAHDLADIQSECERNGLILEKADIKSDWMTARFLKK